jgi:hypothetical protein
MNLIRAMRVPLIVWLVLEGVAAASLVWSAHELPPRVASHFNIQGQADGWMPRERDLQFMAGVGLLVPLLLIGTGLLMGVMPAASINIPGRDYWLAPERRHETNAYLARHTTWFACAMTAFFIGVNWLVVEANRANPPRLSNGIWLMLAPLLVFTLVWLIVLVTHFSRVPREAGKVS